MTKLLPKLGILSSVALPIMVVTSCSFTSPSLSSEAAKFTLVKTTKPDMEVSSAVNLINNSSDAEQRLTNLKSIVDLPSLSSGFIMEVVSASLAKESTSLDVKLIIVETESKNSQEITWVITNFKEDVPTLVSEAAKFDKPFVTTNPFISSEEVIFSILSAIRQSDKYIALSLFAPIPPLSKGFSPTIGNVAINKAIPTQIDATITITETLGQAEVNFKEVTFVITNLSESSLWRQNRKFETVKTTTPSMLIDDAIKFINSASGIEAKINALKTLVQVFPTLDKGFSMEIKEASANPDLPTSMDIVIAITQSNSLSSKTVTQEIIFTISGFAAAIPTVNL